MRTIRRLLTALLAATDRGAPLAHAGSVNPGVLSPGQKAFGKSYGAWSAAWWQYVVSRWLSTGYAWQEIGRAWRRRRVSKINARLIELLPPRTRVNVAIPIPLQSVVALDRHSVIAAEGANFNGDKVRESITRHGCTAPRAGVADRRIARGHGLIRVRLLGFAFGAGPELTAGAVDPPLDRGGFNRRSSVRPAFCGALGAGAGAMSADGPSGSAWSGGMGPARRSELSGGFGM